MADSIIELLLLVKNGWGLTGDLAKEKIYFSTRLYDEHVQFPQIVIKPIGFTPSPPIDMGAIDITNFEPEHISFNIYVRPLQDSNTSLGWAKNAIYLMRRETERILRSGSILILDDDGLPKYVALEGWIRNDDYMTRPPTFILSGQISIVKYLTNMEGNWSFSMDSFNSYSFSG